MIWPAHSEEYACRLLKIWNYKVLPVNQLPASVAPYVSKNYNGAKIKEAGKVTDAVGKHMYEVEIKGKDLIFDENGVFIKED